LILGASGRSRPRLSLSCSPLFFSAIRAKAPLKTPAALDHPHPTTRFAGTRSPRFPHYVRRERGGIPYLITSSKHHPVTRSPSRVSALLKELRMQNPHGALNLALRDQA
jgi:hypothetical protein